MTRQHEIHSNLLWLIQGNLKEEYVVGAILPLHMEVIELLYLRIFL